MSAQRYGRILTVRVVGAALIAAFALAAASCADTGTQNPVPGAPTSAGSGR